MHIYILYSMWPFSFVSIHVYLSKNSIVDNFYICLVYDQYLPCHVTLVVEQTVKWPLLYIIYIIKDMQCLTSTSFIYTYIYIYIYIPSVTDMQYYFHARHPNDDWHLAYMLSLVYFSVDVCLVGVFPHSVSTKRDPSRWLPPSRENKGRTGVTRLSTWAKWGGIWTDAWVCLHYWVVVWDAGYFNSPLYCTVYGVCHKQDALWP